MRRYDADYARDAISATGAAAAELMALCRCAFADAAISMLSCRAPMMMLMLIFFAIFVIDKIKARCFHYSMLMRYASSGALLR